MKHNFSYFEKLNIICFLTGLDIHYVHVKPKLSKTTPILLVHGWPGSVREFYELIEILEANKKFNLELIAPSLPGFGFSEKPGKPGFGLVQAAIIFKKLMTRLGHHQFYIQGTIATPIFTIFHRFYLS